MLEKNVFLGLLAAPLVIKAAGVLAIGAIGAVLAHEPTRKKLFELMGKVAEFMGKILTKALQAAWAGLKFGAQQAGNFLSGLPGKSEKQKKAEKAASTPEQKKQLEEYNKALREKNKLEKEYYQTAAAIVGLEELKAKGKNVDGELKTENEVLKKRKERVEEQLKAMEQYKAFAKEVDVYEEADFRRRKAQEMYFRAGETGSTSFFGSLGIPGMRSFALDKDKLGRFKSGGPITVPGSGSGDKMFSVVQPGSFVMNRNAVGGFQTGGVPVMLEPGEQVYGPGQWGPVEQMMNSLIPRFQQGGAVKDAKPPTAAESKGTDVKGGKGKGSDPSKVAPGGKASFIGTGDGITGEFSLIDGNGKKVGSWQATSGTYATAGATQEQRMNVSGTNNPLPDGNFPLLPMTYHPGQLVGDWSAYINNGAGQIGSRGQLLVHNDVTDNGTAGCIGINNLGGRGSKKSMEFAKLFENVAPGSVKVDLMSSSGKPGTGVTSGSGQSGSIGGNPLMDIMGGAGDAVKSAGGAVAGGLLNGLRNSGLPGLADFMQIAGEELGSAGGAFMNMVLGGAGNFFSGLMGDTSNAATTPQTGTFGGGSGLLGSQPAGPGISPKNETGGMSEGGKPGAMGVVGGMGFSKGQWDIYRNTLAKIESGGVYDIAGGSGGHYDGRYQLGAAAKSDAARILGVQDPGHGPGARSAYRKDAKMQEEFFAAFTKANYNYLMRNPKFAEAKPGRKLEILGYAHNQGMGGAESWLNTGRVGADGFGTKGTAYSEALKTNLKASGYQQGGIVDMRGRSGPHMRRFNEAQQMFEKASAAAAPIVINNMGGAGGGGGVSGQLQPQGTPGPPTLPDGPSVVALMDLTNRVAMGAMI
jgi:hypothetical protein